MDIISKQPNGLLCVYSTSLRKFTHYNITPEEYVSIKEEQARNMAKSKLAHCLTYYEDLKESILSSAEEGEEQFLDLIFNQMENPRKEG